MPPIRKRLARRETRTWRFLTFSCFNRLPLLRHPRIADLFARRLADARERCGFLLRAWVVMPEHVHLMLLPRDDAWPVSKIVVAIKQPVAQHVIARWRKLDAPILEKIRCSDGRLRFWQPGGGFDRNVRDDDERAREVEYIHWNPVRRRLVEQPTDWPWSSARAFAGWSDVLVPIDR